jgi:uncharacterized protein (UPF0305 family)
MTDKELFEKTEKVFNLKNKNILIEKVYNKGNFKKNLQETSPIRSNYADNTVSAGRAAGRGALGAATAAGRGVAATGRGVAATGRGLGAVAKGAGSIVSNLFGSGREKRLQQRMKRKQMAQDLKKSRQTLSADKRKAEAQARQEEIKAQQAQVDLMSGKKGGKQGPKPKEGTRQYDAYINDSRYRKVWDAYAKGEEKNISAQDIDYYNAVNDKIEKGTIDTEADKKAKEELRNKAAAEIDNNIKLKAPKTEKYLTTKKLKDNYTKFMLGDELTINDLKTLAFSISEITKYDKEELSGIKSLIAANNDKLTSGAIESFIKDLPKTAIKQTTPDIELKQAIQNMAKQENLSPKEILMKLNKEADKFKIDDIVLGSAGATHEVIGKDPKTGTVVVRSLKGKKRTKRFAKDLRLQQKSLEIPDAAEEVSFEQIIKKYR